jgi:hypothetical protein
MHIKLTSKIHFIMITNSKISLNIKPTAESFEEYIGLQIRVRKPYGCNAFGVLKYTWKDYIKVFVTPYGLSVEQVVSDLSNGYFRGHVNGNFLFMKESEFSTT